MRELTCKDLSAPGRRSDTRGSRTIAALFGGPLRREPFQFLEPQLRAARAKGPLPARGTPWDRSGHRPSVHHYGSVWPPCGSFACRVKSRMWPRFNACITPIRPNIVGPPSSTSMTSRSRPATRQAPLFHRKAGDVARRVARVISLRPSGSADRQIPVPAGRTLCHVSPQGHQTGTGGTAQQVAALS